MDRQGLGFSLTAPRRGTDSGGDSAHMVNPRYTCIAGIGKRLLAA